METFNVYKHPIRGIEAVKVGFSWPALLFGVIWMLVKKMWFFAGIWFGIGILLASELTFDIVEAVTDGSEAGSYLILAVGYFVLWLIPAFKGNKWRKENLAERGYEFVNAVQAETPDAAIALVAKQA